MLRCQHPKARATMEEENTIGNRIGNRIGKREKGKGDWKFDGDE